MNLSPADNWIWSWEVWGRVWRHGSTGEGKTAEDRILRNSYPMSPSLGGRYWPTPHPHLLALLQSTLIHLLKSVLPGLSITSILSKPTIKSMSSFYPILSIQHSWQSLFTGTLPSAWPRRACSLLSLLGRLTAVPQPHFMLRPLCHISREWRTPGPSFLFTIYNLH